MLKKRIVKNREISSLKKNGYVILDKIFSKKKTKLFKKKLEKVYRNRKKKGGTVGSDKNQVLYNYFYEDLSLLELIYQKKIDDILIKLLDEDYVLQASNAQNRILKKKIEKKNKFEAGMTWHTDSRYLGNKRISRGFSYLVIIALDAFTKFNGPTKFIPYSFKNNSVCPRHLSKKIENKSKDLLMKEGSVCIMDSGMWHRGGETTKFSRWSIFSIYTGWFVKPYFNYKKINNRKIKKIYKKLLHDYSVPPQVGNKVYNTLKKFN